MSARTKSPLHPSALSINDMNVGRRIIKFSLDQGIVLEGRIIRTPYVKRVQWPDYDTPDFYSLVDVRNNDGHVSPHHLEDLGVIPHQGSNHTRNPLEWNTINFTIDSRKEKLLPEVKPEAHFGNYNSLDYPFDDVDDYYEVMRGDFVN